MTKKNKMKVGDLVCLWRRRLPGMGIVLKQVDDIEELSKVKGEKFYELVKEFFEHEHDYFAYEKRQEFIAQTGIDEELVAEFWMGLNPNKPLPPTLTQNSKYPARSFVYVRWFKSPSEYHINSIRASAQWYPTAWVKKYN